MTGKVYLVGAGPGDPELLTLKALRLLREADVVLHDDLVSPAIVKLASPGALVANVGKRCGRKRVTQEQIHTGMIGYAQRGLTVVRLKGGDPMIFGRAGEEMDALTEAEVDFEVVPGVTAASSAAAEVKICLTDRRSASSLVFLSGHPRAGKTQNEWPRLGSGAATRATPTVVVYMPGSEYSKLRDELLAAGLRYDTPCLLVAGASGGTAQAHFTSVDQLSDSPPLPSPKIVIAGEVAGVRRLEQKSKPAAKSDPVIAPRRHRPLDRERAHRPDRTLALAPER
jgi:uroporphyrin-III C-methyltransferase / precorrin-2 dehydrogenase / sirohydrochlorin ferrochelatase